MKRTASLPTDSWTDVQLAKAQLRKRVLASRAVLSAELRSELSAQIAHKILLLASYRSARAVMAYVSFGSEFATSEVLHAALADGKILALPRIDRLAKRLLLYRVTDLELDLEPGVWGILEPKPDRCAALSAQALDLILVPGVAFDALGNRLGYGGGYYDRLLGSLCSSPFLVAGAFSMQVVDRVPVTPHDKALHLIVTEQMNCGPRVED